MTYEEWDQRSVPDAALAALISVRHWSRLEDLARFAVERHGFGDSNGGFGITYPTDLDEHDRDVDKGGEKGSLLISIARRPEVR